MKKISKVNNFKILAPFVNVDQVGLLREAGADELYCGYIDEEAEKLWPSQFVTMNHRGKGHSFEDFNTFKFAIEKACRCNLPVYVTMNGLYTPEQYPWLLKTINKISELKGVRGLIIADMGLLLTLNKINYKKEIHISTVAGPTFNYSTADFFNSLGASRIILDRQLAVEEIVDLISLRKTNIAIELFIAADSCLFIDGYCTFIHYLDIQGENLRRVNKIGLVKSYNTDIPTHAGCQETKALLLNRKFEIYNISGVKKCKNHFRFNYKIYPYLCNLCALYELKCFKEITLKVAWRGCDSPKAVKMVSSALKNLSRKDISYKLYREKARALHFGLLGSNCTIDQCYSSGFLTRKG